jgi:hypothetical protein
LKINVESLIEIIVKEVIAELLKMGVEINLSVKEEKRTFNNKQKIDMSNYKTPVLTENMLESIETSVNEIIVPKGTVITPGAREVLKKRNFIVSNNY